MKLPANVLRALARKPWGTKVFEPAKYTRVVIRIAEREHIRPAAAVKLYQRALRLGVRDYSKGLADRIARIEKQREADERRELGFLRDLAMAGMSSLTRTGRLGKRDAARLRELEAKYGA